MNMGKLVFAQIMEHLPPKRFLRCVPRYVVEHKVKTVSCLDRYLCMAFAQPTYRESLRDIDACMGSQAGKLYHMGIRSSVARDRLANANAVRDRRVYADLAQSLIGVSRRLCAEGPFGVDLRDTVYARDASAIDLCLSVYPWAPFRPTKPEHRHRRHLPSVCVCQAQPSLPCRVPVPFQSPLQFAHHLQQAAAGTGGRRGVA
jgi:hypothetical protein